MAEEDHAQERSESPTDERREQFRKRGDVANSREITSVIVLGLLIGFLSFYFLSIYNDLMSHMHRQFEDSASFRVSGDNLAQLLKTSWMLFLKLALPIFFAVAVASTFSTFLQTRFNVSFDRLKVNFDKLNIINGLRRMVASQAFLELGKGFGKLIIIGTVAGLIFLSESRTIPFLLNVPITSSWMYWAEQTRFLFIMVFIFLILIAGIDYIYNFMSLESKMKMTRQQLKEEYKERELDPFLKARLRRMQKEFAFKRTMEATRKATVLITNPTHYSVAIRYEIGMNAPRLVAKGADFLALQMRELAKSLDIPIVENKPLAQTLYKTLAVDREIPANLYKALSEIISYVFKIKGIKIPG
ncbi:MAG: EscU/YscU/HrcU family type III secretion system export apparatus switch protein [Deltaproteobacteria bacterium]|nr:EscU/YscU/HrcU family type III secretion system export apparatus switch protein [Deltaproteobacteria bacterium]